MKIKKLKFRKKERMLKEIKENAKGIKRKGISKKEKRNVKPL